MNTEVVELSTVRREVKVTFTSEEIEKQFDKKTKQVSDGVSIKGFRPGKAPTSVIASKYASEIKQEVLEELFRKGFDAAVREHELSPVGPVEPPAPEVVQALARGAEFSFSLKFDVRPQIALTQYKGVKVTKAKVEVTDTEVKAEIERFQRAGAQLVPVLLREQLEDKDFAIVDISAAHAGAPVDALGAKDDLIEVADGRYLPGFTEKLVGLTVGGTARFELNYPEDGPSAELHGKPIQFEVHLKQIKKLELPTADDEFAKDAGYESLEKMHETVKKTLTTVQEMRIRNHLRDQVNDALIAAHAFDVPESLVKEQAIAILREALARLQREGLNYDLQSNDVDQLLKTYEPRAEKIVRTSLILSEIAEAEAIEVSENDVEKQIDSFATMTGQDEHRVRAQYADPNRRNMLRFQLVDEKVLDFILSHAEISEGEALPPEERQLRA